jgi:hypothetical protein
MFTPIFEKMLSEAFGRVTEIQRSCQFPKVDLDLFRLPIFYGKNLDFSIVFVNTG